MIFVFNVGSMLFLSKTCCLACSLYPIQDDLILYASHIHKKTSCPACCFYLNTRKFNSIYIIKTKHGGAETRRYLIIFLSRMARIESRIRRRTRIFYRLRKLTHHECTTCVALRKSYISQKTTKNSDCSCNS